MMTHQIKTEDEDSLHIDNSLYCLEAKKKNGAVDKEFSSLPKWVNLDKIRDGQEFVRDNFFAVFFAHFISLIFLLAYTPVRQVLVRTCKSESRLKSLKRYFSTLLHVKLWYEQDIVKPNGRAAEDIASIRKVHSKVAKFVEKRQYEEFSQMKNSVGMTQLQVKVVARNGLSVNKLNNIVSVLDAHLIYALRQDFQSHPHHPVDCNNNSEVLPILKEIIEHSDSEEHYVISQLDMTVTQFCFMGFITLFPKHFGIQIDEEEGNFKGLEGFIHLWALIGHLLGIEDKFNLCLPENSEQIPFVLKQILIPELQNCQPATITLWRALTSGISSFVPFVSLHSLLFFVKCMLETPLLKKDNVIGFPQGQHNIFFGSSVSSILYSFLSPYDILCYKLMTWCFSSWLLYEPLRNIFNMLLRLAVHLSSLKLIALKKSTKLE